MILRQEHADALRALRGLTPQERLQAMHALEQQDLHDAEKAKNLGPIAEFRLSPDEWAAFRAHLLDGGGVTDATVALQLAYTAVLDDNQAAFWPELIHVLKASAKHVGVIVVNGDQVALNGIAPSNLPQPKE